MPSAKAWTRTQPPPDLPGAACRKKAVEFVGTPETRQQTSAARKVCRTCPLATWIKCLVDATENQREGIYAGTGKPYREGLRKWNEQAKQAAKGNATT